MAAGSRPAPAAASSIRAWAAASRSGGTYGDDGTQPSASRPIRASMRGPKAPTQIPIGWAGAGPGLTPATR